MTQARPIKFSSIALALGALALLVAIGHFWLGAAAPSPALEDVVANKVVAIRDATTNRLAGRTPQPQERPWNREHLVVGATSLLGGLAIVLGVLGYVRKEPWRACAGAAFLGVAAVAFPLIIGAIGAVILALIIIAFLSAFFG